MCLGINTTYAEEYVKIIQLGEFETSYTADFTGKTAMISRDGSKAKILKKGEKITLPGKYYVCIENNKTIQIESFTITEDQTKREWDVRCEEDLDEILKSALGRHCKQITIKFQYGDFSINEMQSMIQAHIEELMLLYPALVYTGGEIEQKGNDKPTVSVKFNYPINAIETMQDYDLKISKEISEIINSHIMTKMNVFEREEALIKALMEKITYSVQLVNGKATPMSHTIWGGLVNGMAVCDGYAKSLMYSLNVLGIPNEIITGTAKNQSHAWNLLDLFNNYYHVDLTWADQDENTVGILPNYFNELDEYMMRTHTWNHSKYPSTSKNTYCGVFVPVKIKGVYYAKNQSEFNIALKNIKNQALSSGTVILYNLSKNKWEKDKVVTNITEAIGKSICYTTESKYNTFIVGYNVK
ncbi:transglutaminase domain-containing protein [Cellulosilyticum ruminicola]|uniref:transglutaminase domain-containing protein n=1 Tax=Cellulosilyticum ruminicola TaxID=425254 RepID=UPI0006D22DE6|nr:transglutaminase domain-containing protein [Cellulosilyticum ruminicola]